MTRLELFDDYCFRSQLAEDEVQELANCFVETHQWDQIANGSLDIIRGEKGAGKSAIYSLLSTRADEFFDRGILLVAAENPRGTTVFRDIMSDPPATEQEFIWLWKVYILAIVTQKFREYDLRDHMRKSFMPPLKTRSCSIETMASAGCCAAPILCA